MAVTTSTRLGPYEIAHQLRAGGMGEVWKPGTPSSNMKWRSRRFPMRLPRNRIAWSGSDGKPNLWRRGIDMVENGNDQKSIEAPLGEANRKLEQRAAAQRENEERFAQIFEESPLGMAIVESDFRITKVNQALCKMVGYSEEELTSLTGPDFTHPDDVDQDVHLSERLFRGEIPSFGMEKRYVKKDGTIIWVRLSASLVRDDEGIPLYGLGMVEDINERRLAEESARRATSLFENAERMAGLGSWELDVETGRVYCSEEASRMFGVDPDKPFYDRDELREAIHPDDRNLSQSAFEKLLETGEPIQIEYRMLPKGALKHVQVRARLERENGRPKRVVGVSMDITERKLAHEALRESQNKYQSLTEAAPVGIFQTDQKGDCIYVNERWTELAGLTLEQARGEGWTNALHPDDRDRVIAEANEAVRTGQPFRAEHRYRRPDGGTTWVYAQAVPQLTETGESFGHIGTITDITDQKNAEASLRKTNELLAEAENIAGLGGFEFDLDTGRVQCSAEGRRLFGLSLEREYFSRDEFSHALHPDDRNRARKATEDLLKTGEPVEGEYRLRAGAVSTHVQVRARLQREDGRPKRIFGIARDITETRKLERQFLEAQRMEAIGQLAGGVAHDFNNILTVISRYGSLIQDELPADSPMQTSLRAQSKAADRAAGLTRQLLAFGRKQRFEPKVFELNNAVSELRNILPRTLGEDVELVTVLASTGYIEADPSQLEQVILNLAVNARHAMPQGGELKIETSDVELDEARARELWEITPGRFSVLTVTDSGTGMDQDTVLHIFEPFFTTKEKGKGTGLGLAAVYGIVKQSKGAISVESNPGVGTVFEIYLPQVPSPDLDSQEVRSDEVVPRGDGMILLVEDDEDLRVLAAKVLREKGFSVVEVNSARQAEAAVEGDTPIDLVLTDVVMPETSGSQLVERLRAHRSDFKVLYMSGYTDNTSEAYRLVSSSELLDKPFTPADLLRKVNEVLRRS